VSLEYLLDAEAPSTLRAPGAPLYVGALEVPRLTSEGVAARPDLFAARASALAATAFAEEPKLRFVPTLGATGQLKVADSQIAGSRYWDTTLVLALSWTIWDAGVRHADEMARVAAADVAHLQAKQLQRKIGADVRTAVASLVAARASLKAAEEGVAEAGKSVDETVVLYKQGLAKAIELVDANLSRFNAEQSLAAAQLAVHQAELDVRAALGLFPLDGVK
jgi:outer membrane protein TolC